MKFDDCRHFLSSPQSYDLVELKPKKLVKKKRKTVHKHLLNTNILFENDPSKLTMRQRILQQKFQNKKNTMEDLDLISSGIEVTSFNKREVTSVSKSEVASFSKGKESQYKIKLPVCSKIRFECDKENIREINKENILEIDKENILEIDKENILEIDKENIREIDKVKNEEIILMKNNQMCLKWFTDKEEVDKGFLSSSNHNTQDSQKYLKEKDQDLIVKNNQICLAHILDKTLLERNFFLTVPEEMLIMTVNHKICLYTSTELCLYRIFHSPLPDLTPKLKLEDCNIKEINEKLKFHGDLTISNWDLEELKLENLNLKNINQNSVNKPMLHKKRRVLFQESSKKKKEACIYKAAFYITKLETLGREKEEVSKKCIYYTDVLVKAFKEKGCVCKVVGEVKWFLNLN